jgi:hypothetical protein
LVGLESLRWCVVQAFRQLKTLYFSGRWRKIVVNYCRSWVFICLEFAAGVTPRCVTAEWFVEDS